MYLIAVTALGHRFLCQPVAKDEAQNLECQCVRGPPVANEHRFLGQPHQGQGHFHGDVAGAVTGTSKASLCYPRFHTEHSATLESTHEHTLEIVWAWFQSTGIKQITIFWLVAGLAFDLQKKTEHL